MDHAIHLEGHRYRLRPIRRSDAALIVELRGDLARTQFMHPIEVSIQAQERYLDEYLTRGGDYYFVVESCATGRAEGTVGIYSVDPLRREAEMGRWILRPGSRATVETLHLVGRVAFELLDLAEVYSLILADNVRTVSFQDACGLERRRPRRAHVDGRAFVEHVLSRGRWEFVRSRIEPLVDREARRARRAA